MTEPLFDAVIHAPQRLRICAILDTASHVEFGELLDRLRISKSALSKHLSQLEHSGYIQHARIRAGGRSRLHLSFTDDGRDRYRAHKEALKHILQNG